MNPENIKIVEIRDRATFIPAMAIKLLPNNIDENFLFKSIGYWSSKPCILLIPLEAPWSSARCSNECRVVGRSMHEAHKWIESNWDSIVNCQVIDVEYILKEVEKPCDSVRQEQINEALEKCENENQRATASSALFVEGLISAEEYMFKYASWDCWVCNKKRPDKFISVIVHDISLEKLCDQEGKIKVNVKYCNDNITCIESAKIKDMWINR